MFYTAPPPLPIPIHSSQDCKKGSRDCFPENTQGGVVAESPVHFFNQELAAVSNLIKELGIKNI